MPRFVQFEEFGSRDYLHVVERERPWPGPGQILVRVMAAGLNPSDYKAYRDERAAARSGVTLPSGIGSDFSGFVEELGEGVTRFELGQAVLGTAPFAAIADFVVVPEDGQVILKPDALTFEVAGSLGVAGRTAMASVRSLDLHERDTVLVSAAAGGVGVLAAQLAVRAGATVIGTASEENHEFLESLGVIPVAYGEGLADRVRDVLDDDRVTAVLDNHGPDTIDAALELGVPIERVNSIAVFGPAARGAKNVGGHSAGNDELAELADLLAENELVLPIDSIYPIERTVEAFGRLEGGHVRGKVVVVTD
ncbi:NADP-dependent oxidoreductase [Leifsonia shinshuensis]|uniref:NADP-dependent oxidoreductase n=1 Tax=Leifsonia shinshuensis TaxID=150026 RepID=UPI002856CBA4|nr:NADP-dependent oxidoreductase [Leifsonia shinshuensis]MDR6969967.1 NADPH:quinone reductase-like Zn-dependent oxidoreductase [Leifsonia shinshuensis]